jgi:hypothetical protein
MEAGVSVFSVLLTAFVLVASFLLLLSWRLVRRQIVNEQGELAIQAFYLFASLSAVTIITLVMVWYGLNG